MRKQTVRKTKKPPKKRNHTRRKRGGGLFDFLFKRGPSVAHTNEFRTTFTKYITEIIALQDAQRTIRDKDRQSNYNKLQKKMEELKSYVATIPNDVDKNIRLENSNTTSSEFIGGLPIHIIARTINNISFRDAILKNMKEQGFAYHEASLNIINGNRESAKLEAEKAKEALKIQMKKFAKQKEAEEAAAWIEADERTAQHQNKLAEQKEAEKAEQLQKELAEKAKKEAAEQLENEHEAAQAKQKADIDAIKIRRQKEENVKKAKLSKNFKTNLAKLEKEKTSSKNIEPEVKVVSSTSITREYAEYKRKESAKKKAAENDEDNFIEKPDPHITPETTIAQNTNIESQQNLSPETTIAQNTNIESQILIVPETTILPQTFVAPYRPKIKPIYHPMYTIDKIPEYWTTYFPNGELYFFHNYMFYMLDNVKLLTDNTQKIFPGFILEKTQNAYINRMNDSRTITSADKEIYIANYEILIRLLLLFIGIIANTMSKHGCHIILKGGKAIQMNCHTKYPSNDIDILVVSDTLDKKEIALEMGKLLVWILSSQIAIQHLSMYYVSMIEIPQTEPIVKISAFTHFNTYEAIVDIGFTTPKEEIKSYIVSNPSIKGPFYLPVDLPFNYQLLYITQSVDAMIKEKLYYYMKYAILNNYKPEDNAEFFIQKIYRSLKALLSCKTKDPITQKQILLTMITNIIREKKEYLIGIDKILPQTILDGVIEKIK